MLHVKKQLPRCNGSSPELLGQTDRPMEKSNLKRSQPELKNANNINYGGVGSGV